MKTILVLTDFTDRAGHAADFAFRMAEDLNANLLLYNCFTVPQAYVVEGGAFQNYEDDYAAFERKSNARLESEKSRLKNKMHRSGNENIPEITYENELGSLADNLPKIQGRKHLWMIVMGDKSKESFFNHLVYGSETSQILKHARCPVMMVPEASHYHFFKKIALAATSFTGVDLKALDFLAEFAKPYKSEIIITHVSPSKSSKEESEKQLNDFRVTQSRINYEKISFHVIREDDVAGGLMKFSKLFDIGIVALVNRKHAPFEQMFHESNIKKMMEFHKIPVLVFPQEYQ